MKIKDGNAVTKRKPDIFVCVFAHFFFKPVQDRIAIVKGTCQRFDVINVNLSFSFVGLIGATCIVVTTQMLTVQFCKNGSYLHFERIKFSVGSFLKNLCLY